MNKHLKKFITFYILMIISVSLLGSVFVRKSLSGSFDNTNRINGFYNLKAQSLDMLFVGSSHAYTGIDNNLLQDEYQINSYNFSSPEQPIELSYFFIKEALKTQSPKTIVLEAYMFNQYPEFKESTIRHATDNMPLSKNKIDLINSLVNKSDRIYYFFPMLKYHTRWNELTLEEFDFSYKKNSHEYLGQIPLEGEVQAKFSTEHTIDESVFLDEKDLLYFDKIVELSKKHGFELILYTAPYNLTNYQYTKLKLVEEYALKKDIEYIDLNNNIEEFDTEIDFFDSTHLSKDGAIKATRIFIERLEGN